MGEQFWCIHHWDVSLHPNTPQAVRLTGGTASKSMVPFSEIHSCLYTVSASVFYRNSLIFTGDKYSGEIFNVLSSMTMNKLYKTRGKVE